MTDSREDSGGSETTDALPTLSEIGLDRFAPYLLNRISARYSNDMQEELKSFDMTRKPLRHLGFGDGIHFCLGAPLARLQARAALRSILDTIPEYEVQSLERYPSYNARGVSQLVVAW